MQFLTLQSLHLSWEGERHFETSEYPSNEGLRLCTVEGTIDADTNSVAPGSAIPLPVFLLPAIHDDISMQVALLLQELVVAVDSGNEISQYLLGFSIGNFSRIGKLGHILFTAKI